jgi:hypothetical protein
MQIYHKASPKVPYKGFSDTSKPANDLKPSLMMLLGLIAVTLTLSVSLNGCFPCLCRQRRTRRRQNIGFSFGDLRISVALPLAKIFEYLTQSLFSLICTCSSTLLSQHFFEFFRRGFRMPRFFGIFLLLFCGHASTV